MIPNIRALSSNILALTQNPLEPPASLSVSSPPDGSHSNWSRWSGWALNQAWIFVFFSGGAEESHDLFSPGIDIEKGGRRVSVDISGEGGRWRLGIWYSR